MRNVYVKPKELESSLRVLLIGNWMKIAQEEIWKKMWKFDGDGKEIDFYDIFKRS